jgi:hypothetical protein
LAKADCGRAEDELLLAPPSALAGRAPISAGDGEPVGDGLAAGVSDGDGCAEEPPLGRLLRFPVDSLLPLPSFAK